MDGTAILVPSIARMGTNRLTALVGGTQRTLKLTGYQQPDDHNGGSVLASSRLQPGVIARSDGRALVAFGGHGQDNMVRLRLVDVSAPISTGLVGTQLPALTFANNTTYARLLSLATTEAPLRVALITRSGNRWLYRLSEDHGTTWGGERTLFDGTSIGQCYVIVTPVPGETIWRVTAYGHPFSSSFRNVVSTLVELEEWTSDEGPDLVPLEMDVVVAPSSNHTGDWVVRLFDVGYHDGYPIVVYGVWNSLAPSSSITYKVRRLNDYGSWVMQDWALEGGSHFGYLPEARYVGGACFTPSGGLVTSRESGGHWVLEHWPTAPDWSTSGIVAQSGTDPLVRPAVATLPGGGLALTYHRILNYPSYTTYDIDTEARW